MPSKPKRKISKSKPSQKKKKAIISSSKNVAQERKTMSKINLTIPAMYADHHVTLVRQALLKLNGVENVIASAAFNQVTIEYSDRQNPDSLIDALRVAGYAPGRLQVIERSPDHTADPAWDVLAPRIVTTNKVDLQMSGEFRKY
jgi:copper chaperone CopZ